MAGLGMELLVAAVIMAFILLLMLSVKYDTHRRRRLAAGRVHMSTEEFIASVDAGPMYDALCVVVRTEAARQTKLPVETTYSSDTMEFLESLADGRLDTVEIVAAIEKGLKMSIPDEIAKKMPYPDKGFRNAGTTLADCIRGFIGCEEFVALLSVEEPSGGE
jgi:hypothetical protein